jgi:hypothetical protein
MDDSAWRRDIKHFLDGARYRITHYTGLYSDEDLIGAVLHACRDAAVGLAPDLRLDDARSEVEARCRRLVQAADRFAVRDLAGVTAARAQTLAAVDAFQDLLMQQCRLRHAGRTLGPLLKKRAH